METVRLLDDWRKVMMAGEEGKRQVSVEKSAGVSTERSRDHLLQPTLGILRPERHFPPLRHVLAALTPLGTVRCIC